MNEIAMGSLVLVALVAPGCALPEPTAGPDQAPAAVQDATRDAAPDAAPDAAQAAAPETPDNVLLIIADDLGVDRVGAYGAHPQPGRTPSIDALAADGVLFRKAWAYPMCSPTRATMLTGRYGFRTGVGTLVRESSTKEPGLPLAERTLPELLGARYATRLIGKWHLAGSEGRAQDHPQASGFGGFAGSLYNLGSGEDADAYFDWDKCVDGQEARSTTYATTDSVDEALAAMEELSEPWFIWLAFNAPHRPFHAPPAELHSFDLRGAPEMFPVAHMKAMTEAMDTEIGRLLEAVDRARTTVIFIGDNGTTGEATDAPFDPARAKGTLYEGGVHVPLIVAGSRVTRPGSESDALVCATDVFATVADIAGLGDRFGDSVSFLPYLSEPDRPSIRDHLFAEIFRPNGPAPHERTRRAIRGPRYKLLDRTGHRDRGPLRELYDLDLDPFEENNLVGVDLTDEQAAALAQLETTLERLLASE